MTSLVYTADGHLHDTYRLLDRFRPAPAGSRHAAAWAERDRDIAREERQMRAEILTAAADLDPTDTSDQAEHLREVAEQARDHTDADNQRIAWAAAALRADPTLADRLPPSIFDAAAAHMPALDPAWGAQPTPEPGMTEVPPVEASAAGDRALGAAEHAGPQAGDAEVAGPQTAADLAGPQMGDAALGELPELGL
jgi:hypothetical protein